MEPLVPDESSGNLRYVINHVFLPPRLPQQDDTAAENDLALVASLYQSLCRFRELEPTSWEALSPAIDMVGRFHRKDPITVATIEENICDLTDGNHSVFYFRAQNAALLATRKQNDMLFEAFELLAPNNKVMSCEGALLREFPARAALVKGQVVDKENHRFKLVFAEAMSKLERDLAPNAHPKSKKGGSEHAEIRDTIAPVLVTGMLMDLLTGLGRCVEPKRYTKRSREQVNWSDSLLPFHRSPVWLLLRVSLRLVLEHQTLSGEWPSAKALYKAVLAFHHCRVLQQATASELGSEHGLLHCLNAKIARRVVKLDPPSQRPWIHEAKAAVSAAETRLKERWTKVQANDNEPLDLGGLASLSFGDDCNLRLEKLGPYLSWVKERRLHRRGDVGPGDPTTFYALPSMELPTSRCLDPRSQGLKYFELLEFEAWVDHHLGSWRSDCRDALASQGGERRRCQVEALVKQLEELINIYYQRANEAYSDIPEGLSVMFLTIMELWVALDDIAGQGVDLLWEYDPDLRHGLLNPLLLGTKKQMGRLQAVEEYLLRRHQSAGPRYPSAFSDFGGSSSFAVRYFKISARHQSLLETINTQAEQKKQAKIREYEAMASLYRTRIRERDSMYHNSTKDPWGDWVHDYRGGCTRCQKDRVISQMKISIFEWPLPANKNHAMAAVFEIDINETVKIWRSATTLLLTRVFGDNALQKSDAIDKLWWLATHSELRGSVISKSRLHPASCNKRTNESHYNVMHIRDATAERVCPQHGTQYSYYDEELHAEPTMWAEATAIPSHCCYARPGAFESWVRSPNHTSNQVIAKQASCPENMSLEEFRAIGNLRSGDGLQWANILCQLVIPALDLNKESSCDLIMQSALEAGAVDDSGSVLRRAHVDAGCERYSKKAVDALWEALRRVQESWQNEISLCILARLTARLLSVSSSAEASNDFLALLEAIRRVSIGWARELVAKLDEIVSALDRDVFSRRILMSALICASTFDMDAQLLRSVLGSASVGSLNLSIYTEVAALIHDYLPGDEVPSERISRHLFDRWQRTKHASYKIIIEEVSSRGNTGLDQTMKRFWGDFIPSTFGWRAEESPRSHVLVTDIKDSEGQSLSVSFNTLKGLVLVRGYPLARLPESYQTHPTFIELFGRQILDVMPSALQGMQFSARREQMGWSVHFAMIEGRLVIRAITSLSSALHDTAPEVWEFIPREHIRGDLPSSFVEGCSHWVSLSTGVVQFRAADKPWVSTPDDWALTRNAQSSALSNKACSVVDPHSNTANRILKIMGTLESKYHINCIFDRETRFLAVDLPRFCLSFGLFKGQSVLTSKDYPGMCVGEIQGIGTLIGLKNKLVLAPESPSSAQPRKVLVPEAQFSSALVGDHVKVIARPPEQQHIRHHAFEVNKTLGLLSDNGALQGKMLVCYLHALTSHCLPDPLTLRTGTEESLRLLRSAAIPSANHLDTESAAYLQAIANISPLRRYYPDHLQVMETVKWSERLPPLSQHDDFWQLAQDILQHFKGFGDVFSPSETADLPRELEHKSSERLVKRAQLRSSVFRVSEFGAESGCETSSDDNQDISKYDCWYRNTHLRHQNGLPEDCNQVSLVVRCLDAGIPRSLHRPRGSLKTLIRETTGDSFSGRTQASLRFTLENLRPPAESIGKVWCNLHNTLRDEPNKYRVMFFLSTLLYAEGAKWEVVHALMLLSMSPSTFPVPPAEEDFNLDINRQTFEGHAEKAIGRWVHRAEISPAWSIPRDPGETNRHYTRRRESVWQSESQRLTNQLATDLANQLCFSWSLLMPARDTYGPYIDIGRAMQDVRELAENARISHEFFGYLDNVARSIDHTELMSDPARQDILETRTHPTDKLRWTSKRFVGANPLFSHCPAPQVDYPSLKQITATWVECKDEMQQEKKRERPLSSLLCRLSGKASQSHQRGYIEELRLSAESNMASPTERPGRIEPYSPLRDPHDIAKAIRAAIDTALSGGSIAHEICLSASMYPRLSPVFILGRLTRGHWGKLSREWQICLVNYALSLIYLQRAERLAAYKDDPARESELSRELANLGSHDKFDPLDRPESLLLEIEQGILIRPVQQRIAEMMTAPPNDKSAVMQLNMGEGKSSVIVPLVALALADGSRLVVVVVAKPQSKQMMHTLTVKLSGLLNRKVFYLPFSRSIRLSTAQVETVRQMIKTCREEGGVLLVQPEHLLSFKLMGIENIWNQAPKSPAASYEVLKLYQEFEAISRNIVDESDENFSVKFELIYTMGSQQPVEMSPDRWILIETVLELLRDVVKNMFDSNPGRGNVDGILFEERVDAPGGFPTVRVLEEAAGRSLIDQLGRRICSLGLPGFPIHNQTSSMREAVLTYMLKEDLDQDEISRVEMAENGLFGENTTKQAVLLLRGLLAGGVLLFALGQKRYRVNYGLAPDRRPPTMLAVPYRAKDMPSPRSEFSHPDVIIVLTCLSYYYRGLSFEELFISLETLGRSDLANQEYSIWASAAPTIPPTLRHFSGINLKDEARCRNLVYPALRFVKPAIDFYLSNVVFAKEMKEFPSKLSASGWDLAKPKTHPLTGFSGTIDSKRVLPLAITALDLPDQRHTNAAVLDCLLREENEVLELRGQQAQITALTVEMLLDAVTESGMRVILDVGAQIIECSNDELARRWLDSASVDGTDAVIFFNDDDELSVLSRNGGVDAFLTSPFASNTERCLVFLDQAHTRGTDLRLPDHYRAAVTLGPAITKDTLVQACMRMRKLGRGQSVTFCISEEMQRRIRAICSLEPSHAIAVVDVLEWAISETWDEEVRSIPLWENQGIRHLYQETVWARAAREGKFSQIHAQEYIEPEAQTLEHRYRPITAAAQASGTPALLDKLTSSLDFSDAEKGQLEMIQRKAEAFKTASITRSSNLQEEQERELAPEIEQERQVERPPKKEPRKHKLHPDVEVFALTGRLKSESTAFLPPFQALEKSSAAQHFPAGVSNFPSDLLITRDYARTVDEGGQGYCSDTYQRPVQWVLTSKSQMVIISQWEANKLKAILMSSSGVVVLRAYLPRPSLTFRTLEDLQLYIVPATASDEVAPELIMQLNLFAGQLYLRSYQHYIALCRYLGLSYRANGGNEVIAADGFVGRRDGEYAACRFETSPVMFLSVLFKTIRRDCTGIEKTHMGKILVGEILTEKDFVEEV